MEDTKKQDEGSPKIHDGGYKKTRWRIVTRNQDGGYKKKDGRCKKENGVKKQARWGIEEIKMEDTSKRDKGNKTESQN